MRSAKRAPIDWWLRREVKTRSHSELDGEDSQRLWYCILRCGRVGRCQSMGALLFVLLRCVYHHA